jgi:UDP-N-acetylmuramate: L-alanyl-gamma-D-glutamyl-meso-diaminopimelate ligase
MNNLPKRVHIIGIAGVATSALAIAFHKAGVKVTGSDKGFFPPVSTELEKQGVEFYAGWHPEKMFGGEVVSPDGMAICVVGTASGTQNPETAFAKKHNIPCYSYPEMIGKFFVKKNSIVCAGTWGKTSSAALLSHILLETGFDPSYMFGGISLSHESAAHLGKSDWSVFEGDEYRSSPTDSRAKFFHYKPTHLLLTAVSWDHADLYPTEKSYFEAFEKLVKGMSPGGFIVANKEQEGVTEILKNYNDKIVWYGRVESTNNTEAASRRNPFFYERSEEKKDYRREKAEPHYSFDDIKQTKSGLNFKIKHQEKEFTIKSPVLGAFQAENITGCFTMAHELGVPTEKIIAAIASFKGMKRRLEKRLDGDSTKSGVTVFDDIAHSPEKAASVLKELRTIYQGKIIAVFEPNSGGRERASAAKYENAFKDTDVVIIPRLTKLKTSNEKETPMEGDELAAIISRTHKDCSYLEDDNNLVNFLLSQTKKDDIIAFLGSHGFRGMIEEVVKSLKS